MHKGPAQRQDSRTVPYPSAKIHYFHDKQPLPGIIYIFAKRKNNNLQLYACHTVQYVI